MSIEERIKATIAKRLNVDLDEVVPYASFVHDLGAESLDVVELIVDMEKEFDIDIPDEEAEKLTTVQDVFDYIKRNYSQNQG